MWAALWELDPQDAMRTHKVVDGILQSNVTLQETLLKTQDLLSPSRAIGWIRAVSQSHRLRRKEGRAMT
jgi:hypothetical protein